METVNGEFIMQACEKDDPKRLRTIEDLYSLVHSIGFLPLFASGLPGLKGFSAEERMTAYRWWTGDKILH